MGGEVVDASNGERGEEGDDDAPALGQFHV